MMGTELIETDCTAEEIKKLVQNGDYESALYINSLSSYDFIVNETSLYDYTSSSIFSLFSEYNKIVALSEIVPEGTDINSILYPDITENYIELGINQMDNFMYTYILIFVLYLAVIVYGQYVITGIITEKTSRAMEVLITSAKPNTFIMAKIMGAGLAGLMQLSCVLFSAFIFYNFNVGFWEENTLVNSIFNIPSSLIIYMLTFFILGYFIYAFMFGAVGSLASRMEDASSLMAPVLILFIIAFYITLFGLTTGDVNSTLMVVASYVPFTSSMAMFTRIAMSHVEFYEIIISIAILIISTFIIGFIASKIYRMGVLFYGNKPKFKEICKIVFSKN